MPVDVGIRFAHASLQVIADDNGIDLLHIKGPAVDDSLLEARSPDPERDGTDDPASEAVPRRSIDADVLVRPRHVDRLFDAMHRHGWTMKYAFEDGSAFEHAATMVHPVLAPVDVHRRFPGIDADADAAFESLWSDRHTVLLAGMPCVVPSVTAQRLVLILHATRAGQLDHPDIVRSWAAATEASAPTCSDWRRTWGPTSRWRPVRAACTSTAVRAATSSGGPCRPVSVGVRLWLARVRAARTWRSSVRTAVHSRCRTPTGWRRLSGGLRRPERSPGPTGTERGGVCANDEARSGPLGSAAKAIMSAFRLPSRVAYVVDGGHRAPGDPPPCSSCRCRTAPPWCSRGRRPSSGCWPAMVRRTWPPPSPSWSVSTLSSVAPDVVRFLEDLVDLGLVEPTCSPTTGVGTGPDRASMAVRAAQGAVIGNDQETAHGALTCGAILAAEPITSRGATMTEEREPRRISRRTIAKGTAGPSRRSHSFSPPRPTPPRALRPR